MNREELEQFERLLAEVESRYRVKYPSSNRSITDWTGNDILGFQEDLREEVQGQISEKWFYTHVKTGRREKLPRIDVLNMLSRYASYRDWQEFTLKNPATVPDNIKAEKESITNENTSKSVKRKKFFVKMAAIMVLLGVISIALWKFTLPKDVYRFCFYDQDKNEPILNIPIEIIMMNEGESPIQKWSDSKGCFEIPVVNHVVRFVVKAPYYKTDTIIRNPDKAQKEEIFKLKTDDFALMIHIFSRSKIDDWKSRRKQLDEMISDNAKICQIDSTNTGMEIYNKSDFIDKLTMPLNSLKNIEILETMYKDQKIIYMRFIQKL